jgi:sugar lactone lactonase YvrE
MEISRIGEFTLGWGESLVWDEQRQRLYCVDCASQTLHWLDDDHDSLETFAMPSMPTGVVPMDDGRLVVVLDDGLHVIDPDARTTTRLSEYPAEIGGRCNDACADLDGNLITGKLNLGPAEGSAWWYSVKRGWRMIDSGISNTNGPNVGVLDDVSTLIIGDTAANYYAYPYDGSSGTVGTRTIFGDVTNVAGHPDGATLDNDGGLWCALFAGGQLARFTSKGLDQTVALPVANPTDVTFGGRDLDRLYVTSIAAPTSDQATLDGALLVIDGLGVKGRLEPRFSTS